MLQLFFFDHRIFFVAEPYFLLFLVPFSSSFFLPSFVLSFVWSILTLPWRSRSGTVANEGKRNQCDPEEIRRMSGMAGKNKKEEEIYPHWRDKKDSPFWQLALNLILCLACFDGVSKSNPLEGGRWSVPLWRISFGDRESEEFAIRGLLGLRGFSFFFRLRIFESKCKKWVVKIITLKGSLEKMILKEIDGFMLCIRFE